jgi:hypothetical protein
MRPQTIYRGSTAVALAAAAALALGALTSSPAAPTSALLFGVNTHQGADAATNAKVAAVMKERNLKSSRMDLFAGNQTAFRDQVERIRANGGRVEAVVMHSWQWDTSCNPNLGWVEQDSYDQTAAIVDQVKDLVEDFEMLNEVQLRPDIQREVDKNSAGTSTAPYHGKRCVATLTAVLRGMSRAIHDAGARSGRPLRAILGAVGRDFGFLAYMQQQGVAWDVTGYHIYPRYEHNSLLSDRWFGAGGPLAQLASFGKPIHINELNCGEIYDSKYENQPDTANAGKCLRSLAKHLGDLRRQRIANVESIHIYELLDEPGKPPPENRFGLMYSLARPKTHLYLVSAFAGGNLTAAERNEITSRGLMTHAEIDSMRAAP